MPNYSEDNPVNRARKYAYEIRQELTDLRARSSNELSQKELERLNLLERIERFVEQNTESPEATGSLLYGGYRFPSSGKLIQSFDPFSEALHETRIRNTKLKEAQAFVEFQAYDSLGEILKEWGEACTTTFVEVKFVKPSNLAGWQSTIYRCATMVKVFKTLDHHMAANLHQYNFIYQCKTLYRKTTHVFEYDPSNFAFVIRTGLGSGGQAIKNISVPFYEQVRQQLHDLLVIMKQELPQSQYEQVFGLYVLIKDKRTALVG